LSQQEQIDFSARRGAEWLFNMNGVKGRFVYGFVPALNRVLEGDHYLRQVGAAFALARAARCLPAQKKTDDRTAPADPRSSYAARATQALLVLLDETVTYPGNPEVRYTPLPSSAVNRLASAGLLVLAVHELPAPQADLLDKTEQLCNYIRTQQRPDGSLNYTDPGAEMADLEGVNYYPGEALYGLMRSLQHQGKAPPWKIELVRKALDYYARWWREHKNMAFVPWHTAAYTEAYLHTRDKAFADFVLEMNDWLCERQYERLDPGHPEWLGGFMSWVDGRAVASPPQVASASYAESLAEACQVARESADLPRFRRYSEALERCLQFLITLQYSDANTQHFSPWYRQRLLGGFHASHQDGDLRIDFTHHAVCAMIKYLSQVAPAEKK
jgi:hypothetical protein